MHAMAEVYPPEDNTLMKRTTTLRTILAFALPVSVTALSAQNLVPNPSFEVQDTCPAVSQILLAPPWNTPTLGTPDLFNTTCASQNSPAHTGVGSSGVFAFCTFANSREYIQAPLTAPLQAGQGYCVSFWVLRNNFQLAVDRLGARLRTGALSLNQTNPINETPQVESPGGVLLTGTSWIQISGQFVASGGEDHIIIGNFHNDANTNEQVVNPGSSSVVAYYKIDDVSVTACAVGIDEAMSPGVVDVFPQPTTGLMYIRYPASWPLVSLELTGMDGRLVHAEGTLAQRLGAVELDLTAMPAGMYVLTLRTATESVARRVVVQH